MKKNSVIIIGSIGFVIILAVLGIIFYPKYLANKENSKLYNEVDMVNNYLLKNIGDIKEINDYIKSDITSGDRKIVEEKIDNYLKDLLNNTSDLNKIDKDEKLKDILKVDNIKEKDKRNEAINYLKKVSHKLDTVNESFDKLNNKDTDIKEDEMNKLYQDLVSKIKIDDYYNIIDNINLDIKDNNDILDFLNKNSNWKIEDDKVIFTKRNTFNEYEKLNLKNLDYELIKDTKGPVIKASNISITKGNKINIKDKVKCEDAVDGKTECKISGNYDTNKVGSYDIKITSTDQSKNSTNKVIKLTVKEKVVNNKPYYIEVIRNQNVVIVYGLDNNNQYTKIVKVFVCSVGKSNSKTPTGTYKTQDKASWGWLVGNLYGQYYTRIVGSILFHSVPYTKKAKSTLEWDEYNKLGTPASKGCIRMTVRDVKWIYDNCPKGTTVKIYDGSLPSGVSKPSAPKISADSSNKGWDPTDPDKNNPWKK